MVHKCLSPIYFNIEGEKEITVNTNVPTANWTATSNADWVKVHKTDGKVTITADPSSLYTTRCTSEYRIWTPVVMI